MRLCGPSLTTNLNVKRVPSSLNSAGIVTVAC